MAPSSLDTLALLKAIADPVRWRALQFLLSPVPSACSQDERGVCACDFEAVLGLSQPTVSHHMKHLVDAGLVRSEKRGRWVFYEIIPDAFEAIRAELAAFVSPSAPTAAGTDCFAQALVASGAPGLAASPGGRPIPAVDVAALRDSVRAHYAERSADPVAAGSTTCCGSRAPNVTFEAPPSLAGIPSFGCGDPAPATAFVAGETVVDLGSGAGRDAFAAAAAVGPRGHVIGVDMTPQMISRARAGATRLGLDRVEFREGLIERLPLEDGTADVVISNCVFNLVAAVPHALAEASRVLRPGGRLRVSDTFRQGAPVATPDRAGWCACVDGAHDPATLIAQARTAGFVDVAVAPALPPAGAGTTYGALLTAVKPDIAGVEGADAVRGAALLVDAGLPVAGWHAVGLRRWRARDGERLVGVVALEVHGRYGLLRSLAVAEGDRQRGIGGALLAHALRASRALGLRAVAALTTTIPATLAAAGFHEVVWAALPVELHASDEIQGACPSSARVFFAEVAP